MKNYMKLTNQEIEFLQELLKDYYSDDISNTSKCIISNLLDKLLEELS